MTSFARRTSIALALALAAASATMPAAAQPRKAAAPAAMPISPTKIDETVARAMKAFEVPGMAVGIVKDGKLIYSKGYGVREQGKSARVDADTLFQIGSNTKAFTAAALSILIDEGKIGWDDKVIDHLPQFRMYDPYVTREFTIRDLLTHRSGLGLGAGDLMVFPESDITRDEIIHGLRYLKPVSSFRSRFDYDNTLYMVAGQIIPAVTGKTWDEFVETRILAPLGMQPCSSTYGRIRDRSNLASPHIVVEGKLTAIPVMNIDAIGPAGTINCSINGMAKWLMTQLDAGKSPSGKQLFSAARGTEMWTVNTPLPVNPRSTEMMRTHFSGYGLGWGLEDVFGYKKVAHTGGVAGTVTWVAMVPELKLGVLVFTNQQSGAAMTSVGNQILDAYLKAPARDWVEIASAQTKTRNDGARAVEDAAAKVLASAGPPSLPLDTYVGTYNDPWRGDATVRREGDGLVLKFSRTKDLEGPLLPYSGNIFIARWKDRSLEADSYVRFEQGYDGKVTGMKMQAVSPATDFSFDFHDLDFTKVEKPAK
ncbi:serine hydrolase [Sphingomonas colocasiae]|uniref:Serine hydrolase n=1 Tax=Sphingomonas colocasiae TaxID=1848973 RepID=A0ABS7PVC3_9SPHN|nr:serine hydrolase [Sphingomonas colocasiae]